MLQAGLLAIWTVVFLGHGLAGILIGRRVVRQHGPGTPMLYPTFLLDRLLGRTAPARTVVRVGWLFLALTPIGIPVVYGFDAINPWAIARRARSACGHLVTESELAHIAGRSVRRGSVHDEGFRCSTTYWLQRPAEPDREILEVRIEHSSGIGRSWLEMARRRWRSENRRVVPLEDLGERAFWAAPREAANVPRAEVVLTIGRATLLLEADATFLDDAAVDELLELVSRRRKLIEPYGRPHPPS